jgi:hypothetical protein
MAYGALIAPSVTSYTINAGGVTCAIDSEMYPTPDAFLFSSPTGEISCQIQHGVSGLYNTTFIAYDASIGLGNAKVLRNGWQVDPATGALFQYKAHPTIYDVSLHYVGLRGASSIVIQGSGFSYDPSANVVMLAGVPCVVTASTIETITCSPGAVPASTNTTLVGGGFPLGRGLVHLVAYVNNPFVYANRAPFSANDISQQFLNSDAVKSYCTNCGTFFAEDMQGVFVPPVTANYSFWVRGDDASYVWLSKTSNPAGAVQIASSPGATQDWYGYSSQISAPQYLIAGQSYFFQARHLQLGGWTDFYVGVRIHTTGNAAASAMFSNENQRIYNSIPEVRVVVSVCLLCLASRCTCVVFASPDPSVDALRHPGPRASVIYGCWCYGCEHLRAASWLSDVLR